MRNPKDPAPIMSQYKKPLFLFTTLFCAFIIFGCGGSVQMNSPGVQPQFDRYGDSLFINLKKAYNLSKLEVTSMHDDKSGKSKLVIELFNGAGLSSSSPQLKGLGELVAQRTSEHLLNGSEFPAMEVLFTTNSVIKSSTITYRMERPH
ncbi:hypothetical protein [Flaviaesturariibacter terrae]